MNITNLEKNRKEFHIPGYNFCGPGTHVFTRLRRGDKGINALDEACKRHDIEYMKYAGDDIKLKCADKRLRYAAKKIGGLSSKLVDKIFFLKTIAETLHFFTPSSFAGKLSYGMPLEEERKLGRLLYDKYIRGKEVKELENYN